MKSSQTETISEQRNKPMQTDYQDRVRELVYGREVTTRTGWYVRGGYIHIEQAEDYESTVRVDDIHDGKINFAIDAESDSVEFDLGMSLSPEQARTLASALYEAANVVETWEGE